MGLTTYTIPRAGTVSVRDMTFADFDRWLRRSAASDRDPDDTFPELLGLLVKQIDGQPWEAKEEGDIPPVPTRALTSLQALLGEQIAITDDETAAADESRIIDGDNVTFRATEAVIEFRVPSVHEYQRARRAARIGGVWLLDLMRSCLVAVDGRPAPRSHVPLSLRDGLLYRDMLRAEIMPDDKDLEAARASAKVTTAG